MHSFETTHPGEGKGDSENPEKSSERTDNASRLFSDFIGIQPGEKVLFLTDADPFNTDRDLIEALQEELKRRGVKFEEIAGDENLAAQELFNHIKTADVVWSSWDMEKTAINFYDVTGFIEETGKRMVWSPGVRVESLNNDGALAERKEDIECCLDLMESKLRNAAGLHIRTWYGTDLTMELKRGERRWFKSSGILRKGGWDNLPGGEIFTTPDERNVNGVLVLPVLQDEVTKDQGVDKFVRLTIRNGKIAKIDGGRSADKLREYLEMHSQREEKDPTSVIQCSEIAFGANAKARTAVSNPDGHYTDITRPTTETEKRLGTMHIAFGSSKHGEKGAEGFTETKSGLHLDFVIPRNGLTVTIFKESGDLKRRKNGEFFINEGRMSFL